MTVSELIDDPLIVESFPGLSRDARANRAHYVLNAMIDKEIVERRDGRIHLIPADNEF